MIQYKFIFLFIFLTFYFPSFSLDKKLKIKNPWSIFHLNSKSFQKHKNLHNSTPLLFKDSVIQADQIDGLKSYRTKNGKLLWTYLVKNGISTKIFLKNEFLYFGGGDGSIHIIRADTGDLFWKYFLGSSQISNFTLDKNTIYFSAEGKKIYALSLKKKKEKILWIYSSPKFEKTNFYTKTFSSPFVHKNILYLGIGKGWVVALDKKNGRLQWMKKLSDNPILYNLKIHNSCLLVPVLDSHLYCLNQKNGKLIWKSKGGSSDPFISGSTIYQIGKNNQLYALSSRGKVKWVQSLKQGNLSSVKIYKDILIYGFFSRKFLDFFDLKTRKIIKSFYFGNGLSPSSMQINQKTGDLYFLSKDAYLYKLQLIL